MDDLRSEFKAWRKEKGLGLEAASRALGISAPALSQWESGSYKGNITKIDKSVKHLLELDRERLISPKKDVRVLDIVTKRRTEETFRIAHVEGIIVTATGDTGLGKTSGAKDYERKHPDVILLEADPGWTAKAVFSELHKRLGLDGIGIIHDMFDDVVLKLRDSGRLIIVDEAEHLPYRALELLRRLHDKAGIGLALVGMPRLMANLRGRRGEYLQLYSRIGLACKLEPLTLEDANLIVSSILPNNNGIGSVFHKESQGNTRLLSRLIYRSKRVAEMNDSKVTPEIIRKTAEMLLI